MAVRPYPGVYIDDIAGGPRAIAGVSTSVAAFIGWFAAGPIDEPVLVTSWAEVQTRFGGLHPDSEASYALWMFFRNGGATAWVVRLMRGEVDDPNATPQTTSIQVASGELDGPDPENVSTTVAVLEVTARDPGAAGNFITVTVSDPEIANSGTFDLTIERAESPDMPDLPPRTESFKGLHVDGANGALRPEDVESSLVTLQQLVAGRPSAGSVTLTNGGTLADQVVSPSDTSPYLGSKYENTGLHAFGRTNFNLLCLPGVSSNLILDEAIGLCEEHRAMLIVDAPTPGSKTNPTARMRDFMLGGGSPAVTALPRKAHAAVYYPWIEIQDPLRNGSPRPMGPCGMIAGLAARTDGQVGVWKAPAGTDAPLVGVWRLAVELTDEQNGVLNQLGVNCLRRFDSAGMVCWGARTLRGADSLADRYKYVPVRRLTSFIEASLYEGTQWVVFQPNNEVLWRDLRITIRTFMNRLYEQGAFAGATPDEAFQVQCDRETNPPDLVDNGIVTARVYFAPVKPAEFVVIELRQIQQLAAAQ
ncbi:MAG: phage tail sheath subtilisin-like domain-containing protein [Myxococcota bacterium]